MLQPLRFLPLLLLVSSAALPAPPATQRNRAQRAVAQTLDVGPDGRVTGLVGAQPVHWMIDASGSSAPVLNPDAARRLGLSAGWVGIAVGIGPVRLAGRSAVLRYTVDGVASRRRGVWFDRAIVSAADGMIGPGGLRQPIVRFILRPARAGETETTLPLVDRGIAGMGTLIGDLFIQFDPRMQHSLATAAGGVRIAERWGGQLAGATHNRVVRLNVARPVRRLDVARPVPISGIHLRTVDVRTLDYGSVRAIPDADAPADPSEIVVVARGRPRRNQQRVLIIGADALTDCSSISFDKPRRLIRLRCAAT